MSAAEPPPGAEAPGDPPAEAPQIGAETALDLILGALQNYPAPVAFPVPAPATSPPRVMYVSPIPAAVTIYAQVFSSQEGEGDTACAAFAEVLPKVCERVAVHIAQVLNEIADGAVAPSEKGAPGEKSIEHESLAEDLHNLATVFAGSSENASEGPYALEYATVCEAIETLISVTTPSVR